MTILDPAVVFRDYVTTGVPSSGANPPIKSDIRALFTQVPTMIVGAVADGTTNDAAAITAAVAAYPGRLFYGAGRTYRITSNLAAGFRMLDGVISDSRMVTTQDDYSVIGIGQGALAANTYIPEQFAASGGRNFAAGNHLVAIGWGAGNANTTGRRNTFIGSRCGLGNTTGYYNTFIGSHAGEVSTTAYENTGIGVQVLESLTTGPGNTGMGTGALNRINTGTYNTAVGWGAGCNNTNILNIQGGNYNTWIGYRAGYVYETGDDNVAVGRDACVSLTTGQSNTVMGATALTTNATGSGNVAIGNQTLKLFTGSNTVAVGLSALAALVSGAQNTALGYQSGLLATGDDGTFLGYRAGFATTSGLKNTFVGRSAGATVTTGGTNTMIGYSADTIAAADNSTSIGNGASCTASNQVTLGNSSVATLRCQQTSITALSDQRFKKNIRKLEIPDGFLDEVEIVAFDWMTSDMPQGPQVGVIAQQLDQLQQKYGVEWLGLVDKTNSERWEATPGKMLFPLIQKVQKLCKEKALAA